MRPWKKGSHIGAAITLCAATALSAVPGAALAQDSPFKTGADALVDAFIALATPIAIIVVMALGVAAAIGRISWGWPIMAVVGIAVVFGASIFVNWIRGLFGV